VKKKRSVLNEAPRHEHILGNGGITPRTLNLGTRYTWGVTFTWATGWTTGVRLSAEAGIIYYLLFFLFATASSPALGPTQPPIQLAPGVKRPGREADHSPPSSAEVKNT